jgi:hypothetical protein
MATKAGTESLLHLLSSMTDNADDDVQPRQNKTIRIRKAYNQRLMDEAHTRSKEVGHRITESDVIDEALSLLFAVRELQRG